MAIITIVDDGYDVRLFKSVKDLIKFISSNGYIATDYPLDSSDDDAEASSPAEIRKVIRSSGGSFYLYDAPHDGSDWVYKVHIHQ